MRLRRWCSWRPRHGASISWVLDAKRQRILDSWPAAVDDTPARREWGFSPAYDFARAFDAYLVPRIRARAQRAAS